MVWLISSFVFIAALLTLYWALSSGWAWRLAVDTPNERSLHVRPTPRVGGLLVMPWGLAAAWMLSDGGDLAPVLGAAAALLAVSFLDDRYGMPVVLRFGLHLLAALVVAWLHAPTFWLVLPLALALGWMTNLYNFMDGADGVAGGMAVAGFGAYAWAAWQAGDLALAQGSLALVAVALAFLCFNFPPARIFMGDGGSIPLGFLAGALGLVGWTRNCWPFWFPLLTFSPFIVDASVTLLRRLSRGEKIWQAHREHSYQKLVRGGWSHRRLLLVVYPLMVAAGGSAVILREAPPPSVTMGAVAWLVAYALLLLAVERHWRARGNA